MELLYLKFLRKETLSLEYYKLTYLIINLDNMGSIFMIIIILLDA